MWPPQDRINYAEMRVQKIQIPIQVPVLKPVYVDYPYPNYKFVEGESKVALYQRKYFGGDVKNILNNVGASRKIERALYDDTSSESSSDSDVEQVVQVKKVGGSKSLNEQKEKIGNAQIVSNNEQAQYQINFQNQQQNQTQQQQYNVDQQQYIQPPIQLDYPTANQYKPPSVNQSFSGKQQQFQQTIQNQNNNNNFYGKDSTISQNASQGRDLIRLMKNQNGNGREFGATSNLRM